MMNDISLINRYIESDILNTLKHFPVVAIVGPRQVGKTTLSKQILSALNIAHIYLDLESLADRNKLREPEIYLEQNQDKCIVLDEIQRMPELFPLLRSLIDKYRVSHRFIILGSASPELLRQSSESLAGRIAYFELTPFNLTELSAKNDLFQHWFRGGFPIAYLAENDLVAKEWLRNFIQTYIERDLPQLGLGGNQATVMRFWYMLAHVHGGIWNASTLAKSLELSVPTINKYLDFFEHTFLVTRLQPWFINAGKRLVKSPKMYIRDTGVLHQLADVRSYDQLYNHILCGNSFEGYVIEQIKQITGNKFQCYYYRTQAGAECDLILAQGISPKIAIEIKFTNSPVVSKGLINSIADLKTEQNFIITPTSDDYMIKDNIRVCNVYDFLTGYLKGAVE
jgi:uncharacterized protein